MLNLLSSSQVSEFAFHMNRDQGTDHRPEREGVLSTRIAVR
jgi:hypothetical protein